MMEMVIYNYDLAIEETDEGYAVRLVAAPDGEGAEPFIPPLSDADLALLWSAFERRAELEASEQLRVAREIGARLFAALIHGTIAASYRNSLRSAYQARAALCVRLNLAQAPNLTYLPWEYLFDSERAEFVALSGHSLLVRHLDLMHQIEALPVQPPLRVLVVVAEPDTYAQYGGERRWLSLVDSIDYLARDRRLLLERLAKPSLFDLQRRLRQRSFHVVHFIGHGVDNPLSDDGQLIFEDEIKRGRTVSGMHLGTLLRDHHSMRLAIVQSCDEFADGIRHNPFAQVAQNMVLRNVPAVIALPQVLTTDETAAFHHAIYAALAAFRPIAAAVGEGRSALYRLSPGVEWGLPLLYSRAPGGYLFDNGELAKPAIATTDREPSLWERVMQFGRSQSDETG